jgi:hypothetical protein
MTERELTDLIQITSLTVTWRCRRQQVKIVTSWPRARQDNLKTVTATREHLCAGGGKVARK